MDENPEKQEKIETLEEQYMKKDPWEKVGFARPLAGFFYGYMLSIFTLIIGIVMAGFIIAWLYPWPEAEGYRSVVSMMFNFMFQIFDIGTAYGIERFVAEYRIKDPKKMIGYIQFFIWYQMMTGLVQVTIVALLAFYFFPVTNLSYSIWIVLIYSTIQYPSMLGMFKAVLDGLQHFNKTQILGFIGGQGFQQITNIAFILIGRWIGAQFPAYGELMGLAIGATIGSYIDDFFTFWLSSWYFSKAMSKFGVTVKSCFRHDLFDRKMAKECTVFGVQTTAGPLFGTFVGWTISLYWITLVPQFTTWATLSSVASGLAGVINMGYGINLVAGISESFLNGKKNLARFYMSQSIKYSGMFAPTFFVVISLYLPVIIQVILRIQGAENYVLAVPFLFPWVLRRVQEPYGWLADNIMVGSSHPTALSIIRILEECGKLLFMTIFIVWLKLPQTYGLPAIAVLIPCGELPAILAKTVANWLFIQKKVVNVRFKEFAWQAWGASSITAGVIAGICLLYLWLAWNPLVAATGYLIGGIISVLFAVFLLLLVFFIIYSFVGGWDDFGLGEFRRAMEMSGPSKPFIKLVYTMCAFVTRHSPFHGKFPMRSEEARKEAIELMILKEEKEREAADQKEKEKAQSKA
nr:hypothetical protein [Candidatus Sigynarchaeota archaeon]